MVSISFFDNKNTYTVKEGDTIYSIARANGVSPKALMAANDIKDGDILSIGRLLTIPSSDKTSDNDIKMMPDIPKVQLERLEYLNIKENGNYKVKPGDNIYAIAKKYKVEPVVIMNLNSLDENSVLNVGRVLKIPPTRTPKNINNLKSVSAAMGVSYDFILKMKRLEDGPDKKDNEFHNDYYYDGSGNKTVKKGNKTIGIGHLWKKGEPEYLSNAQVLNLYVKDLLKAEDHLRVLFGEKKFDNMPVHIKEALIDIVFNKGTDIIKNSNGLMEDLKNGRYDDAICKMTNNRDKGGNGKELSGLSKRRLFDMAAASKYKKTVSPQVTAKAQEVYNNGIKLLKKEYESEYKNILVGYNEDVRRFWGDKIKLIED